MTWVFEKVVAFKNGHFQMLNSWDNIFSFVIFIWLYFVLKFSSFNVFYYQIFLSGRHHFYVLSKDIILSQYISL